ncbi:hypothetical protein ACRRTK_001975 [Alexandromys fortis]
MSSSPLRQEHFLGRALGESAGLGGVLAGGGAPQRWVEPGRASQNVVLQEVTRPCDLPPPAQPVGGFSGPEGRSGRLADVVTPLWRLSYEEQLKVKFEAQKTILQRLESYLQFLHGVHGTVASPHPEGLHCHLHPIIPSPIINGYRNKSTFSVNRGPDGNPKTGVLPRNLERPTSGAYCV